MKIAIYSYVAGILKTDSRLSVISYAANRLSELLSKKLSTNIRVLTYISIETNTARWSTQVLPNLRLQFFRIFSKKHGLKNSEFLFCYGSSLSDIVFFKVFGLYFLFLAYN